jgi:hypothetical protein
LQGSEKFLTSVVMTQGMYVKKLLSSIDLQDVQLVAGLSSLGYGLHVVYPPSAFIILGLIFVAPVLLPPFVALWRAK